MNTALLVLAIVCAAVGLLGAVVPGLPGPPLSWLGLLFAELSGFVHIGSITLTVMAVLAVVITVLDYLVPSLGAKKFGGSKYGVWGCNIGLVLSIIGLPLGPTGLLGIVLWPFVGALVGEYLNKRELEPALKAAMGAFVGFLCGTAMKVVYAVAVVVVVIAKAI